MGVGGGWRGRGPEVCGAQAGTSDLKQNMTSSAASTGLQQLRARQRHARVQRLQLLCCDGGGCCRRGAVRAAPGGAAVAAGPLLVLLSTQRRRRCLRSLLLVHAPVQGS